MFERYTEKARRTIFFGRYEASQFGSPCIESEHLLLGLLRENKALANQFLQLGLVESIRKQVEDLTLPGEKVSTSIDLPLSNECKRILVYAAEEADKLSQKFIGTEHLFLGVLREQGCLAAKLLAERGVTLRVVREQIGSNPPEEFSSAPKSPGLPAGYRSHRLLYNKAAAALILELRARSIFDPTRLFARHKDIDAYEQVGNPNERVSYQSPVTCESLLLLMFNSMKLEKGGDWEAVYSFNLITKELAVCVSREGLRFSEPHGLLWILDLVSLSEDARILYVKIGIEKIVSGGGIVHYYLARVDLPDQEVTLMSRLQDIHF